MLIMILGVVLGVFMSWDIAFKYANGFSDYLVGAFLISLTSLCGILVGGLVSMLIGQFLARYRWLEPTTGTILALRNVDGVSGSFFLGTGSIQGEPYYFFYLQEGEGYKLDKLKAENVVVYEEDRKDGELKTWDSEFEHWVWFLIAIRDSRQTYEFHIPNGSLKRDFSLS